MNGRRIEGAGFVDGMFRIGNEGGEIFRGGKRKEGRKVQ